jgi:hypothetical protein
VFQRVAELGSPAEQQLNLPFYLHLSDVIVLHGQEILQQVKCLA